MNRDFLSNFEQPKPQAGGQLPEPDLDSAIGDDEYTQGEYRQNVCFIWPDQSRRFFEYSRLDSGELDAEYRVIRLYFGADVVELIGIRLLSLFESFMEHKRKTVYCDDARYNDLNDSNTYSVNEINIKASK